MSGRQEATISVVEACFTFPQLLTSYQNDRNAGRRLATLVAYANPTTPMKRSQKYGDG